MKQTPELDRIEALMRPGGLTLEGFLGQDPRRLVDILVADEADVQRLGLTHGAIAAAMRRLSEAGRRGLGEFIAVAPHFSVRVESVRGVLPCPFGHAGVLRKENTTVRNERSGGEVTYTDLNTHMIEAHGFYEGKGSPFRLEPAGLREVLEIRAEPEAP